MTAPTIIPIDPEDREAWLAQRRLGIGSSDVAPILGMSHFSSAYSTWVDKVEGLPEDDNDAMKWGRKLEAVVADEFAERHPEYVVVKPTEMYAHAEHAFMQANPDRLLHIASLSEFPDALPYALLEIKTSNYTDDWIEGPPDYVLLQVQHQLAVMDLPKAYIALLMFGREYREWEVERDEATIGLLVEHEAEFWRRVVEKDPPPPDGSEASTDAVKWFYRDAVDEEVDGGERGRSLLRKRAAVKAEVAEAERRLTAVENELKALFGERTRMVIDGEAAASWSVVNVERFDEKAFAASHPDLHAQFRKPAPYRRLNIGKGWK